jgi:uncharacterized protein
VPRPLVVRVGDLLREPGSRRDVERSVDMGPLETSAARTRPGTEQTVDGEVMAMSGGIELTGEVGFDWEGDCRRCLRRVTGHEAVRFREVAQREPVDDDVLPIDGDLLDLEPLVRELVLAGLPLAPLCSPHCAGPDPERFPTTTEEDHEEHPSGDGEGVEVPRDPRWAPLDDLHLDT